MKNQKGFTFIEIIAVMVIMCMMCIVILPRMYDLSAGARQQVNKSISIELGQREVAAWVIAIMDHGGVKSDEQVFEFADHKLKGCTWNSIDINGGILQYDKTIVLLNREPASNESPARWSVR
jgi:prepilin-type N-terminal cleavage/methylation domain-containing protein